MKTYWLKFGPTSAADYTGLFPTFTIFNSLGITALAAPGITEIPAASGLYRFQYDPTTPIVFECDGGATLSSSLRYIVGSLDPNDKIDEDVTALGTSITAISSTQLALGSSLNFLSVSLGYSISALGDTLIATGLTLATIGNTILALNTTIGTTASSFGDTNIDPETIFGMTKRLQEILEGDAGFNKTTGVWNIYSRGSSTLLRSKQLSDGQTSATKV